MTYLPNELVDGRLGFRRNRKKIKFTEGYKVEEILERHNRQLPEGIWHIEDLCLILFSSLRDPVRMPPLLYTTFHVIMK